VERNFPRQPADAMKSPPKFLLAIDQGTTSSRAVLYDATGKAVAGAQNEFPQYFPSPGWVEHDAMEIWLSVRATCHECLGSAGIAPDEIAAIGITNQRETTVLWDRRTGQPIHRAIVWQDRRTAPDLAPLMDEPVAEFIRSRSGLMPDAYFSGSKIAWILREVPEARTLAAQGHLAAGTIDSWLLFHLSGGKCHRTDVTNASRTMLMNLHTLEWDPSLLDLLKIPVEILPEIVASSGLLATTSREFLGCEIPVCGIAGDQQAALIGQGCLHPGEAKCTFGTGCFLLLQTGETPVFSKHRLLTTPAWKLANEATNYALEGSVFVGGSAIQWLRDGLGLIKSAAEINPLASSVADSQGLVVVPAFTGLGAPHWDPGARGLITGITRGTTAAHLARATLEGIAHQVADLIEAMEKDAGRPLQTLRVDGGASASDLLMQMQADFTGVTVERPANVETTALGAAFLAGLGSGFWNQIPPWNERACEMTRFHPSIQTSQRKDLRTRWQNAINLATPNNIQP